ncbi:hypothetical protein EDD11_008916 [Mortierella claussenii]|nr:hypothetical protein EDD11_008916 [Mortierella claussenii]
MTYQEAYKPHVMIIGAGIAGLTLAAVLERANIPYEIYERASSVKLLGSALAFGPGVMPFFDQLGILDKIRARAKIVGKNQIYRDQHGLQGILNYEIAQEKFGYESILPIIISRPALYEILMDLVPKHKIHFSKRVLSYVETGTGVMIRTSDNNTHEGNILIGADGAYSGVRQSMYDQLEKEGKLPSSDKSPLGFSSVCLVGQTKPLDPSTFDAFEDRFCRFDSILGNNSPYFWVTFTTADNTICWMVVLLLDKASSKVHDTFRNSEWGPEAAESMARDARDFPVYCGDYTTMGDLIDLTPTELMSKVMLEEKFFETWHDGRTVLIGDACHKMTPNAGLGATNGIFDAIVLSNYLSTLTTNNTDDITHVFQQYQNERGPFARKAVAKSSAFSLVVGRAWYHSIMRKAVKSMPKWLWDKVWSEQICYRPQVSFLPPAHDPGLVRPLYQRSLEKARPKNSPEATVVVGK